MILVSRPDLGNREAEAVARVVHSQWVGMGPVTAEFELRLQPLLATNHVVATANGTAALHLALAALDRDDRTEVILPSLTFAATVQAVLMAGYRPVFAEVDPATLTLSPVDVAHCLTSNTRALLPVHFAGLICDLHPLGKLADLHGLALIEDAAHAFGSRRPPAPPARVTHAACFSFSANKNITCGEGGAVATNDALLAERMRRARYLGIETDTWRRQDRERPWAYQVLGPGYRYHLSDIHAAIGLQQLERLESFRQRRCTLARRYDAACAPLEFLQPVTRCLPDDIPHLYVLRVTRNLRDPLYLWLRQRGIHCGVHYLPNHLQPAFRPFHRPLPVTEQLAGQLLSLPLHTALADADQDQVILALRDFANSPAISRGAAADPVELQPVETPAP
jgi:perosamine synthetase